MLPIYRRSCPACHGDIDAYRLSLGLPCRECLPHIDRDMMSLVGDRERLVERLVEVLRDPGDYLYMSLRDREVRLFEEFFEKIVGSRMWSIQRNWAYRLLDRESFALIAPTGMGKSTLLYVYTVYMLGGGKRVYFVTPTRELARQTFNRVLEYTERAGYERERVVLYDSSRRDLVWDVLEKSSSGGVVFISTSSLLSRRYDEISRTRFDVVIADDLDAVLKSSRNVERILSLIGFDKEVIDTAFRIAVLRQDLMVARAVGRQDLVERLRLEIEELRAKISGYRSVRETGQLVVATATGRGGVKTRILRELVDFEAGGVADYIRNVVDVYKEAGGLETLYSVLERIGGGTIVYVSRESGVSVEEVYSRLVERGYRAGLADSRRRDLDRFLRGELDYLVATASFYGVAVRGIDSPRVVRNAVFVGTPCFRVPLESLLVDPRRLVVIVSALVSIGHDLRRYLEDLVRTVSRLGLSEIHVLRRVLRGEVEAREGLRPLVEKISGVIDVVRDVIESSGTEKIVTRAGVIKTREHVVLVPDPLTYIQASGRTSRILGDRLTLGLSVLLYWDRDLLDLFIKRLRRHLPSLEIRDLDEIDIERVKREQEISRSGGGHSGGPPIEIKSVLMIVESPTKARTIASMFGSRTKRMVGDLVVREFSVKTDNGVYVVTIAPTMGHVTDLVSDRGLYGVEIDHDFRPVYGYIKKCRSCGHQFTEETERCPRCGSTSILDKRSVVSALRKISQTVDVVLIATDPDQEGEKIAYDLKRLLTPYNHNIYRIEFHEVTRRAVLDALRSPRDIDENTVKAQIVRRVDDRWVGFIISRELQNERGMRWLGAGRVQTPVLSWIIGSYKRYREGMGYWVKIYTSREDLLGVLRVFVRDRDSLEKVVNSRHVIVTSVARERRRLEPPPPFTTDTLLTVAETVLGLSPRTVMKIAQDLFELGLITYHRTDSVHVSPHGVEVARRYIERVLGRDYVVSRHWGPEGAHEAIRPTQPYTIEEVIESSYAGETQYIQLSETHKRVYDLVFRRFIASQMPEAEVEYCRVEFVVGGVSGSIEGVCRVYNEGFTKIYNYYRTVPGDIDIGTEIDIVGVKFYRGSLYPLYREGDIVRMMREHGIGRPSTYVKAIENNLRHGYVVVSRKRGYLVPTRLGQEVLERIGSIYPAILSEEATRSLEERIDSVAKGLRDADDVLREVLGEISRLDLRHLDQGVREMIAGALGQHSSSVL